MNKLDVSNFLKILGALLLGFFGVAWSFYSLVRLGWLRHGTRILDFNYLRLDWILQPGLPYWGAHMLNLLRLAIGLACILWSFSRLYRRAHEWRAARQAIRDPGLADE